MPLKEYVLFGHEDGDPDIQSWIEGKWATRAELIAYTQEQRLSRIYANVFGSANPLHWYTASVAYNRNYGARQVLELSFERESVAQAFAVFFDGDEPVGAAEAPT